jgi:hypothetical protein
MRLSFGLVALLVWLTTQTLVTQQPQSGSISGTLTSSSDLGRPVRKAQMTLISTTPRLTRTTTTDAEGRYIFPDLPPTDYTLSASKPGYLTIVYGARRPGAGIPGSLLRVANGQQLRDVAVQIPRGGVISGVVTDEFGDPAFGVPVRAMRYGFTEEGRIAQPAGQAITDDLGAYRIAGLMPGEYVVSAVPRDTVAGAAASVESLRNRQAQILTSARATGTEEAVSAGFEARRREGRDPTAPAGAVGYVAVYHPGTASPSSAARIRLGVSDQAAGVDIQLQVLTTATVSGTVINAQGAPTAARVQLIDPAMPIANLAVWFRTASPGGTFSFSGIPPGSYVVRAAASRPPGTGESTAATTVQVDEGGTHAVSLVLRAGVSVSGRIDVPSLQGAVNLRRLQVDLMAIARPGDWEVPLRTAVPDADGGFVIRGLAPARYRIGIRGLPDGWKLASAIFDGADAADTHLQAESHSRTGGVLSFTSKTGEVSGMVTDASGSPVTGRTVILFPSDSELWVPRSPRIHLAQPGADGRYVMRGLLPGDYRLALVDGPEPGQQYDLEYLAQAVSGSSNFTLAEGEQRTRDLQAR